MFNYSFVACTDDTDCNGKNIVCNSSLICDCEPGFLPESDGSADCRSKQTVILLLLLFHSKCSILNIENKSIHVLKKYGDLYMLQPICEISRFMKWLIYLAFSWND